MNNSKNPNIDLIKKKLPLEIFVQKYTKLKQSGNNWSGLCPFHTEKTPSFRVRKQQQTFRCFGCRINGDIFNFVQNIQKINFADAYKLLCQEAGIQYQNHPQKKTPTEQYEQKLIKTLEKTHQIYRNNLSHNLEQPKIKNFFEKRKISAKIIETFQIGYASPSNNLKSLENEIEHLLQIGMIKEGKNNDKYEFFRERIMFPLCDYSGQIVGFSGRTIIDSPNKYLNSSNSLIFEKKDILFGWHLALPAIHKKKRLILVEGYLDVIRLHENNFHESVAICGTSLNYNQLERISAFKSSIYIMLDKDSAGEKAIIDIGQKLLKRGISSYVIELPEKQDPDSFLLKNNPSLMEHKLSTAPYFEDYYIQKTFISYQQADSATKAEKIRNLIQDFANIDDKIQRNLLYNKIANKFQIKIKDLDIPADPKTPATKKEPTLLSNQSSKPLSIKSKKIQPIKFNWEAEQININHKYLLEKYICADLLANPLQLFDLYKYFFCLESLDNQTLKDCMTYLLSYEEKEKLDCACKTKFINENNLTTTTHNAILWLMDQIKPNDNIDWSKTFTKKINLLLNKKIFQYQRTNPTKCNLLKQAKSKLNIDKEEKKFIKIELS